MTMIYTFRAPPEFEDKIEFLVERGYAENRSAVMRKSVTDAVDRIKGALA